MISGKKSYNAIININNINISITALTRISLAKKEERNKEIRMKRKKERKNKGKKERKNKIKKERKEYVRPI